MKPAELLQEARTLLTSADTVDAWSRAAALLARQALERLVADAIEKRFDRIIRPTFSSQLIVLRSVIPPEVAQRVAWTWSALSAATHAHSYELPPTAGELSRWLDAVELLQAELVSQLVNK